MRKYWIKTYIEMLDDPKVARLNDSLWRRFNEALLLAGDENENGYLPALPDMAWRLHLDETELNGDLSSLAQRGLLELKVHPTGKERWYVTKFAERQAPSDAAQRQRESRARKAEIALKNQNKNTDTETETYSHVTNVTHDVTKRDMYAASPRLSPFLPSEPINPEPKPKPGGAGEPYDKEMIKALRDVTGLDAQMNFQRLQDFAQELLTADYTPAQVRAHYGKQPAGFADWNYYKDDWRGKRGEFPNERAIRDTIGGAVSHRQAAAEAPKRISAMDRLLQQIATGETNHA